MMIPVEIVIAGASALIAAIGVLWRQNIIWQERWAKEVKRNWSDPPPDDEPTGVRNRRDLILEEYLKGNGNK